MLQRVIIHTLAAFNCVLCVIIFEDSDSNLMFWRLKGLCWYHLGDKN